MTPKVSVASAKVVEKGAPTKTLFVWLVDYLLHFIREEYFQPKSPVSILSAVGFYISSGIKAISNSDKTNKEESEFDTFERKSVDAFYQSARKMYYAIQKIEQKVVLGDLIDLIKKEKIKMSKRPSNTAPRLYDALLDIFDKALMEFNKFYDEKTTPFGKYYPEVIRRQICFTRSIEEMKPPEALTIFPLIQDLVMESLIAFIDQACLQSRGDKEYPMPISRKIYEDGQQAFALSLFSNGLNELARYDLDIYKHQDEVTKFFAMQRVLLQMKIDILEGIREANRGKKIKEIIEKLEKNVAKIETFITGTLQKINRSKIDLARSESAIGRSSGANSGAPKLKG